MPGLDLLANFMRISILKIPLPLFLVSIQRRRYILHIDSKIALHISSCFFVHFFYKYRSSKATGFLTKAVSHVLIPVISIDQIYGGFETLSG